MKIEYLFAGALALGLVGAGVALAPHAIQPAYAACDPGTHIDATTADWAKRTMMHSGFHDVTVDQKGCDNVWHVMANKDGQRARYAIEPDGEIYPEGN